MITLTLPLSPSRHQRSAKSSFLAALAIGHNAREVRRIMQRTRYAMQIELRGNWDQKNGDPRKRDSDSPLIPLRDAIAQAAGTDDCWFRDFSVKVIPGGPDMITVRLV